MKDERGPIRRRLGPVTLSLVAAVVTAVVFAAISLAASGNDKNSQGNDQSGPNSGSRVMPPPPGGAPFGQDLSDSDQQKLDQFRQCMQDNGAPEPPRPDANSNRRPEPPSAAERAKVQKAYEACKDKLPERLQGQGPPHPPGQCGPPPNGQGPQQGQNQDQSGTAQAPSGAAS